MNPYEILQVKPGASSAEIQQSYRDLVRVWHPDRFASDARLQKVAEEKLRLINDAFAALEKGTAPLLREDPPPEAPQFQAAHQAAAREKRASPPAATAFNPRPLVFLGLAAAATFGIGWMYFTFTAPMRVGERHGPKLRDAFAGWTGDLPQGSQGPTRGYQSTPPRGASFDQGAAPLPPGIGEIQVHNRTNERALGTITAKNNLAARRFSVSPQGEAVLDGLGPAVYFVDVSFPDGNRPPMRIGPFQMMESQTAGEKQGDRYEITLTPPR